MLAVPSDVRSGSRPTDALWMSGLLRATVARSTGAQRAAPVGSLGGASRGMSSANGSFARDAPANDIAAGTDGRRTNA
jgi:hypothetical protein